MFADTSFFVAFYNKKDKNHLQARDVIRNTSIFFIISDYIFDEFLTVLLARGHKILSAEAGENILKDKNICLLRIDSEIFQKAWEIYRNFKDKKWSFTDCTSYVLMKNLSVDTALSFDEHFKQFGFKILP
jgi:predicted nucleic acid-binding protein